MEHGAGVTADASPVRAAPATAANISSSSSSSCSCSSCSSSSSSSSGATCSRGDSCSLLHDSSSSESSTSVSSHLNSIPALTSPTPGGSVTSPHPSSSESFFSFDSDLRIKTCRIEELLAEVGRTKSDQTCFILKVLLVNHPKLKNFGWSDEKYLENKQFVKIRDELISKLLSDEFRTAFKIPSAPRRNRLFEAVRNYALQHRKKQKTTPTARRATKCPFKSLSHLFEL